jgi:hypothetical protein
MSHGPVDYSPRPSYAEDDGLGRSLMFVRPKSQIFLPIAPSSRRYSYHHSTTEGAHRRSQALLDRSRNPAVAWDKYRKSPEELKDIKSRKVRLFYENQVCLICANKTNVRIV